MGAFLRGLRAMPNISSAARLAGITRQGAMKARERDPDFRQAWDEALEQSYDGLEVFAHRMATTGLEVEETRTTVERQLDPSGRLVVVRETAVTIKNRMHSPSVAMFLLRSVRPKVYQQTARVEHTSPPGEPVEHAVYRPVSRERALELARITLELEAGDATPSGHPDIEINGNGD